MKRIVFLIFVTCSLQAFAQQNSNNNNVGFELGKGLHFSFEDSTYAFKLGGMIQPSIGFDKMKDVDANYYLNAKRSYFNIAGEAMKGKVNFFLQTDFSLNSPLLDAWIAYHPTKNLAVTFGQKQTIANNREMMIMEDKLQFPDRSLLSTVYSRTGREFGLYITDKIHLNNIGIVPQIAVTSGDGRNSFGTDSRDVDYGGFKYAGRLDLYPLGFFSKGNDDLIADLHHEQTLKFVVGVAASYNDGASDAVGEGHGDFMLYNGKGTTQYPDYRQVYADLLAKYQGFSLLGEYVVATATSLEGTYVDDAFSNPLQPTEISQYLALGTGINGQLGYVTKGGNGIDFRYDKITPEFDKNQNSIVQNTDAMTVGLSRYWMGNNLKLQLAVSSIHYKVTDANGLSGNLIIQVVF